MVAMDPHTGRVLAVTGGWSFQISEFDRAIQAMRQPGSAFKPIVYLTALENGFTPSTVIMDAPIVVDQGPGLPLWRPENFEKSFLGPDHPAGGPGEVAQSDDRARRPGHRHEEGGRDGPAPRRGRQSPAGPGHGAGRGRDDGAAPDHCLFHHRQRRQEGDAEPGRSRPGQARPHGLPHRQPALRRLQRRWNWKDQAPPQIPDTREQVVDPASAYQMVSMMQGVVQRGTGAIVGQLGRPLAGKTGTTNDSQGRLVRRLLARSRRRLLYGLRPAALPAATRPRAG